MKYAVVDFETASRADLTKIGAWKYAADMSTFALCLGIKIVTDKRPAPTFVLSEKQLHALDPRLMELCLDETVIFVAHNAGFEQAMWKFHCVPMGYPELPPERWHDTMAVAGMKGLPLGLDALVTALELPVKKDMDGHRHMMIMCKPDRYGGWSQHNDYNLKILYDYCASDCDAQYGVYVTLQGLGPAERHTWICDQRYNQRGIRIDTEFVNACIEVLDKVRVPMTERFRELTGLKPTQREKVLNWVNDNGVPLGDMKKATLDAILDPDDEFGIEDFQEPLPYHIHEVLTLRRSLASSSVAKLQRMLLCASATDHRVRYATQFHGARTGRDVGRLIQVQNYPRGEISDRQGLTADILADAILTRDIDHIQDLWGPDIFSAIISSLRSCIVPEEGKVIVSGDYAAVEARNLLSMAGQHDRVEQMHAGLDVYSETASMIYKRPIDRKVQQKEGQIGKNTFLGCLAADTMVLTHTGWKSIVNVLDTDLLWDGEEWVTHQGLAYKGSQETLILSGLRLTANHPVFIGEQWSQTGDLTFNTFHQALAFAKDHGPYSDMPTPKEVLSQAPCASVIADMVQLLWSDTTSKVRVLPDVIVAQNRNPPPHFKKDIGNTPMSAPTQITERGYSTEYQLSKPDVVPELKGQQQNTMRVEASELHPNGLLRGADDLIRSLTKPRDVFWNIWSHSLDGIIRIWKLTASIMIRAMNPAISVSQRDKKTIATGGKFTVSKPLLTKPWKKSPCSEPVYDLVNAGPRHRFMVMTSDGPLIVHNSGYGLGPVGFRARFAPKESIDLAMLAINTYRNEVAPLVPKFWYGLWQASVDAVWCDHAKTYSYAGIEFRKEADFLTMRLPDGKKLYYHRPRKEKSYNPTNGNEYPAWSFMSYQGKKFRRHAAWHGMITADCIQGSARQLMVGAMKRAESAGLFGIFKVHDELVFEEKDRPDLVQTVTQIMEDIEPWARERKFRVKANVESMQRYRK